MPLFDLLFGGAFVVLWLTLGVIPWLATSVATRGRAGLGMLPLCMLAGLAGGMIVPFIGFTDVSGIWLSVLGALLLASLLIAGRRFALSALPRPASESRGGADAK